MFEENSFAMRRNNTSVCQAFVLMLLFIWMAPLAAQQPDPDDPIVTQLEIVNEHLTFMLYALGAVIFVLMTVQIAVTYIQLRRERRQDERQAMREEKRDLAELAGVGQVSKIMEVVYQTLEGRRASEEDARNKADQAKEQYEKVVKPLEHFYQRFQVKLQKVRQQLEAKASLLARSWSRHHFRGKADQLNEFARQFDEFEAESEMLEEGIHTYDARLPYIRGIAAHYSNQPDVVERHLKDVVSRDRHEANEDEIAYKRRLANSYYYLGITESNFGNSEEAIKYFGIANNLDLQQRDFLTRIVTAEAYIMINEFEKALQLLSEVESGLNEVEHEGGFTDAYQRLRSRTMLVKANIGILRQEKNWQAQVLGLLETVHKNDPQYYYATATLAQVYDLIGELDKARSIFQEAHQTILGSRDIETVKEVRSRILLLMVAGLCSKQGLSNGQQITDEYLNEADGLRSNLPKIDSDVCTVFSTLSKRNENTDKIHLHIEHIREGKTTKIS